VRFSATFVVVLQLLLGADRRGFAFCEGLGLGSLVDQRCLQVYWSFVEIANIRSHDAKNSNIAARLRVMQDAVRSGAGMGVGLRLRTYK